MRSKSRRRRRSIERGKKFTAERSRPRWKERKKAGRKEGKKQDRKPKPSLLKIKLKQTRTHKVNEKRDRRTVLQQFQ